jgi:hypothetical protein
MAMTSAMSYGPDNLLPAISLPMEIFTPENI